MTWLSSERAAPCQQLSRLRSIVRPASTRSSSATSGGPQRPDSLGASPARPASVHTASAGRQSSSSAASRARGCVGSSGTTVAPARSTPRIANTRPGPSSQKSATSAPGPTPCSRSARATASCCCCSSA
eukprot:scaffold19017_cov69-Phaeocystis_antarctica.AAC.2